VPRCLHGLRRRRASTGDWRAVDADARRRLDRPRRRSRPGAVAMDRA
jgi:hypothetical protein